MKAKKLEFKLKKSNREACLQRNPNILYRIDQANDLLHLLYLQTKSKKYFEIADLIMDEI